MTTKHLRVAAMWLASIIAGICQPLSMVQFTSANYTVNENGGAVVLTVQRSGEPDGTAFVQYRTVDSSAKAGEDYTTRLGRLSFAGETNLTITIPIRNDLDQESLESFGVELFSPEPIDTELGPRSYASVTIIDNDTGVFFTSENLGVAENARTATFALARFGDELPAFSVDYAVTDGTATPGMDFLGADGIIDFAEGQTNQTFSITILNDALIEGYEYLAVTLRNPTESVSLGFSSTAFLNIFDNDLGVEFGASEFTADESSGAAVITLQRRGDPTGRFTVGVTVTGGTAKAGNDYSIPSNIVTFSDNQTNQTFTIPLRDNGEVQGDKTLFLQLSNPSNGVPLGATINALLTIRDNERAVTSDASFEASVNGEVAAITVQDDGNVLIAGGFSLVNGVVRNNIARLRRDGSLDLSFAPETGPNGSARAVVIQRDGRIVVGLTEWNGVRRDRIVRFNANGSFDEEFNRRTDADGGVTCLALQPDGKIVAGGYFRALGGGLRGGIARLNTDGSLDTTFDPGTGVFATEYPFVQTMALDSENRIVIGGQFSLVNGSNHPGIARLNSNGSVDETFHPFLGAYSYATALAFQPDGKLLVGGSDFLFDTNQLRRQDVVRLNADGSVDTTFRSTIVSDYYPHISALALQRDGKVLIGGTLRFVNGVSRNRLARLHPSDGSLDTSFDLGSGPDSAVLALVVQADGQILTGGSFTHINETPRNHIARLQADTVDLRGVEMRTERSFGSEQLRTATITITRTGNSSEPLSIGFTTRDGTALANRDYSPQQGVINFDPLEVTKTVTVPVLADGVVEPEETFYLTFTNLHGADVLGLPMSASVTIYDGERPGSVDFSFEMSSALSSYSLTALALQSDGKLLVAVGGYSGGLGGFDPGGGQGGIGACLVCPVSAPLLSLFRLLLNGEQDPAFRLNEFSGPIGIIAVQTNQQILVGGPFVSINGSNAPGIARFNRDGSLDGSFTVDVPVHSAWFSSWSSVFTFALQPDGKILLGGDFTEVNGIPRTGLARLNRDGSLDSSFDAAQSKAEMNSSTPSLISVSALALQPNGKVIVIGLFHSNNFTWFRQLVRLNANGTFDATFQPNTAMDYAETMILLPDGRLFVTFTQKRLIRLNTDGSVDSSFNPPTNLQGFFFSDKLLAALQPDGKVLVTGTRVLADGFYRSSIFRLTDDGSLDPSFDAGDGITQSDGNCCGIVNAMNVAPGGAITIAGDFTTVNGLLRPGLARLHSDTHYARLSIRPALTPGVVRLSITSEPGKTYALESSSNLVEWSSLRSATASSFTLEFEDGPALNVRQRFYRAVLQ